MRVRESCDFEIFLAATQTYRKLIKTSRRDERNRDTTLQHEDTLNISDPQFFVHSISIIQTNNDRWWKRNKKVSCSLWSKKRTVYTLSSFSHYYRYSYSKRVLFSPDSPTASFPASEIPRFVASRRRVLIIPREQGGGRRGSTTANETGLITQIRWHTPDRLLKDCLIRKTFSPRLSPLPFSQFENSRIENVPGNTFLRSCFEDKKPRVAPPM